MKGWPGEPDMQYDLLIANGEASKHVGKSIDNIMFDFGNVLVYWDPEAALMPRYSQKLIDLFLDNSVSGFYDANDLMDSGASIEQGLAFVRDNYGEQWAEMFQYYLDNFIDSLTGVVPGARLLIKELKSCGIGVYGLSNWQQDTFQIAKQYYPILQSLDDSVISGFVHMAKPHVDIYQYALQRFDISAENTIFIDDKAMNIVGANSVGVRGIRFQNPRKLRTLLIEHGIAISPVVK